MDKVNLAEIFGKFDDLWHPYVIGEANGQLVKVARGHGEMPWHQHEHEDEIFIVVTGRLIIQLRDRDITLDPGEMFIVPRGVEHAPRADKPCEVLLIEPSATAHTGDVLDEKTVAIDAQSWLVPRASG